MKGEHFHLAEPSALFVDTIVDEVVEGEMARVIHRRRIPIEPALRQVLLGRSLPPDLLFRSQLARGPVSASKLRRDLRRAAAAASLARVDWDLLRASCALRWAGEPDLSPATLTSWMGWKPSRSRRCFQAVAARKLEPGNRAQQTTAFMGKRAPQGRTSTSVLTKEMLAELLRKDRDSLEETRPLPKP